ncbi:MAG: site-specific integrase [Pseudomonadota bacterium]
MSDKKRAREILTPKGIAAMSPGEWAADPTTRGAGRLQVRMLTGGTAFFYYRYTAPDGERVRLPLGSDLTLAQARKQAQELARRYQSGDRDLRGILEAEQRQETQRRDAIKRLVASDEAKREGTFGRLLEGYVAQLKSSGKVSWREVELCLIRHVKDAWPSLWGKPAADVVPDDVLDIVSKLVSAGHKREAAKLRANIRAAFAAAIRARQDAAGLPDLRALAITYNPARDTVAIEGASNAGERALSLSELQAYWGRIAALPAPRGPLLRLHLLTGCQRIKQMARTTTADLDPDARALRLLDPKGRRSKPRAHWVPLIPAAVKALEDLRGGQGGPYLFTATFGRTPTHNTNVGKYVSAVAKEMLEAGELSHGLFTARDLRRTVETRLAAEGVGREVRAHLQSHGLSGVQVQHYDRHDYLAEKRRALEALYGLLTAS